MRLQSYDWVEYLDRMKEDCYPTVAKALPYFSDRRKREGATCSRSHKWTDVMDYVVTRYSHLLDMDEGICRVVSG